MAGNNQLATIDEGALVPESDLRQMQRLDRTSKAYARQLAECAGNEAMQALVTARAIREVQALLTDAVVNDVMPLQNSVLGFRTDKPDGYNRAAIKDCLTIAMMRGLRIVGNEFNIIGGNVYVTKEGYERLLLELEGFSNFRIQLAVPQTHGEGALIAGHAEWLYFGRPDAMVWEKTEAGDYRIAVRVNKGQGVDAILGKAKSKALRQVYARITGSEWDSVGDATE